MENLQLQNGLQRAQRVLGVWGTIMMALPIFFRMFGLLIYMLDPASLNGSGFKLTASSPLFAVGCGILVLWGACRAFRKGLNTYTGPKAN